MRILAIDPGINGAFAFFDGNNWEWELMPINKEKEIQFEKVRQFIESLFCPDHIFLERAVSFGMGTKAAFNYGRGFAALEIAIKLARVPVTYIEPAKWTKKMHEGIAKDLKAKAKSQIAIARLFPQLVPLLPKDKNGVIHDGIADAILIGAFGSGQKLDTFDDSNFFSF